MPHPSSDYDYDEHGHDRRPRSMEEEDYLRDVEPDLWATLMCHCGETIYDVEEGIRTCGHLDDEPTRAARVVPVSREDFLQGVTEPEQKDEPF